MEPSSEEGLWEVLQKTLKNHEKLGMIPSSDLISQLQVLRTAQRNSAQTSRTRSQTSFRSAAEPVTDRIAAKVVEIHHPISGAGKPSIS
jgi:hypothetical protein